MDESVNEEPRIKRKEQAKPREIVAIKMLNSVNFNRTENTSLYCAKTGARDDRCLMLQTALGVEVMGEKFGETLLIPWTNIAFVKFA